MSALHVLGRGHPDSVPLKVSPVKNDMIQEYKTSPMECNLTANYVHWYNPTLSPYDNQ